MELSKQLIDDLERAATSLLTDDEIMISVGITQAELIANYSVVERSRIKLKQRLNARSISDAANNGKARDLVETIPRSKRGGARPGSGRPPGTINKLSAASILESIEKYTGENLGDLLAQGYREAIETNDKPTRLKYETLFLSKCVADRIDITSNGLGFVPPTIIIAAQELPDYIDVIPNDKSA